VLSDNIGCLTFEVTELDGTFFFNFPNLFAICKKLHGLSPRANYTDRATAACRRNYCQLLRIEGATWSA
jgi:hypothetical protein